MVKIYCIKRNFSHLNVSIDGNSEKVVHICSNCCASLYYYSVIVLKTQAYFFINWNRCYFFLFTQTQYTCWTIYVYYKWYAQYILKNYVSIDIRRLDCARKLYEQHILFIYKPSMMIWALWKVCRIRNGKKYTRIYYTILYDTYRVHFNVMCKTLRYKDDSSRFDCRRAVGIKHQINDCRGNYWRRKRRGIYSHDV